MLKSELRFEVLLRKFFAGGDDVDAAEFDAFEAGDAVGDLLQLGGFAFEDNDFEAIVVVQVDVLGRDSLDQVVVLDFDQSLREFHGMVVIDE